MHFAAAASVLSERSGWRAVTEIRDREGERVPSRAALRPAAIGPIGPIGRLWQVEIPRRGCAHRRTTAPRRILAAAETKKGPASRALPDWIRFRSRTRRPRRRWKAGREPGPSREGAIPAGIQLQLDRGSR